MPERLHFESMNPKEHIQRELEDLGIKDPSEWRKAFDHERVELNKFSRLFAYLEGTADKAPDRKKIEAFQKTENELDRLELLK